MIKKCDLCWALAKDGARLMTFSLIRTIRPEGRGSTTRGSGSIVLCEPCWGKTAKPRMKKAKVRARQLRSIESERRLAAVSSEVAA